MLRSLPRHTIRHIPRRPISLPPIVSSSRPFSLLPTSTAPRSSLSAATTSINLRRMMSSSPRLSASAVSATTSSATPSSSSSSSSIWMPTTLPEPLSQIPFDTFARPLETSPLDDREYRLLRLANGLEAMVIHDPKTDKSSAAVDVQVGHLMDPENLKGCAHFCEHLLFLGTKKFPKENEYSEFLSANGGGSNAFTGMDNTAYFFDVSPPSLKPALERFSQFFVSPLFTASCTERELKAVDSEHSKNINSDMWRGYQLEKSLSNPSHPYSKFGTGNWKTLWEDVKADGREPRDELLKWWNASYCSSRMKLVVLGKESLDELSSWVTELFSPVPNKGLPPLEPFNNEPFGPEILGSTVFVKTIKDIHALELCWTIPDQQPLFMTKPANFLAHYLGHEGEGSVLSYLKKKGWVNELSAGPSEGATGWGFFRVSLDLTPEGLENYEAVSTAIFSYLQLLSSSGPQPESFKEVKAIADLNFQFAEKSSSPSDYVCSIAGDINGALSAGVPREKILSQPWLVKEFSPEKVQETLDLLSVERCKMTISSKALPKSVSDRGNYDQKEAIYGTEYRIEKFQEKFVKDVKSSKAINEFKLPGKNAFIPENLDVEKIEGKVPAETPTLLRETELSQLFWKKDDRFWVPRANFWVGMKSPILDASAQNAASAKLWMDLFQDHTTEKVYDAELAGLRVNSFYAGGSLIFSTMGYNDKLSVLMETTINELKNYKVDPERFALLKDDLKRDWENAQLAEPFNLSNYFGFYAVEERMYTPKEKVQALESVTVESLEKFVKEVLAKLHIQTLVHGNLSKEAAVKLQDIVEKTISPSPVPESEMGSDRALYLPESSNHVWQIALPNAVNPNSGVDYYVQVGANTDDRLRPLNSLFSHISREPAFDTLRTKEQLGYLVTSGPRSHSGMTGFHVLVQSENDSVYLENRIEAFLSDTLKKHIEELSEEDFEKQKQSLIDDKLQTVKNLYDESSRLWGSISGGYFDFKRRYRDAEKIKTFTKADLLEFYETYVVPSSPTRRKLSSHLRTQAKAPSSTDSTTSSSAPIASDSEPPAIDADAAATPAPAAAETVVKNRTGVLDPRNVVIGEDEIKSFKEKLTPNERAKPVVPLDTFRIQE